MTSFAITYDYLCPFARIANESLVESMADGADYDVSFRPFSLAQNHLDHTDVPVWDRNVQGEMGRGVLALLWSIVVRDEYPETFPSFHVALFTAKHDDLRDIDDAAVLSDVAASVGLDSASVSAAVGSGVAAKTLETEHTDLVASHGVFGVPTFISGGEAVFVRFMERHKHDDLKRVIDMLEWTNVNEFKRTSIPR
ncbi:MAG: DsbA family protein [Actinomycetota bacterium]|nr:DsbA family protein [Actinomycetota bacterium]